MTEEEFFEIVEEHRDSAIWEKRNGVWCLKDSIVNHVNEEGVEKARLPQSKDRVFAEHNRNLYFNPKNPPLKTGDERLDKFPKEFRIL
jgi:hypothetical protein